MSEVKANGIELTVDLSLEEEQRAFNELLEAYGDDIYPELAKAVKKQIKTLYEDLKWEQIGCKNLFL